MNSSGFIKFCEGMIAYFHEEKQQYWLSRNKFEISQREYDLLVDRLRNYVDSHMEEQFKTMSYSEQMEAFWALEADPSLVNISLTWLWALLPSSVQSVIESNRAILK